MDRQTVIDRLKDAKSLDADEIESAVDLMTEEYVPPTGEGLTRKQARKVLIEEMNKIIRDKNRKRLFRSQAETDMYYSGERKKPAFKLILLDKLYSRHIDQAVCMARSRRGYESLLNVAGF